MYYSGVIDRILIEIYKFSFSMHLLAVFIVIVLTYVTKWIMSLYMPIENLKEHIILSLLLMYHLY